MSLQKIRELARAGRLYPSLILHGGRQEDRLSEAVSLGRILLCEATSGARPCGRCRHCARIGPEEERFHPDFRVLERDLRTATSVEAARNFLGLAHKPPYEARGQVFLVSEAESLSEGAANALLKVLEEPVERSARNFLLLAPALQDLLPTVRSRSWGLYLGSPEELPADLVEELAEDLVRSLSALQRTGSPVHLLAAAGSLARSGDFRDLRATRPFAVAAAATLSATRSDRLPAALRLPLLRLAEDLLDAPQWRLRAVPAERILEGLVHRRLGGC